MILNIILITLILNSIKHLVLKPRLDVFYCGIWGFSAKSTADWNPLNRFKFITLGCENDIRGLHGTGIAYDNFVHKSTQKPKFDDFWRDGVIPHELKYPAIIGHDRKASVGAHSIENTQPICFEFDGDKAVHSILAHNGTLVNYKEMYEKHKIETHFDETDINKMSDSQVLALLLERVGFSVLSEYNGSVAMLYMNTLEPGVFYAYHGKSSNTKYSTFTSEERPLHYAYDEDGSLWFSSTKEHLSTIIMDKSSIVELPFNEVFRIENAEISSVMKIDRSTNFQYEGAKTTSYYDTRTTYAYGSDYGDVDYESYVPKKESPVSKTKYALSEDKYLGKVSNYIYWERGAYRQCIYKENDPLLEGQVYLSRSGYICSDVASSIPNKYAFYFWRGNLCSSREDYFNCLKNVANYASKISAKELYQMNGKHFSNPFVIPEILGGNDDFLYSNSKTMKIKSKPLNEYIDYCYVGFTGVFGPANRCIDMRFDAGLLSFIQATTYPEDISCIIKYADKYPAEFESDLAEFEKWCRDNFPQKEEGDLEKAKTSPENKLYTCPYCMGSCMGPDGYGICKECDGSGVVDSEYIDSEYDGLEDMEELFHASVVELKAYNEVDDVVIRNLRELEKDPLACSGQKTLTSIHNLLTKKK